MSDDQILPLEGGTLPNDQLPIVSDDDVFAILPAYMRDADPAPVRDAIVAAIRVMATTHEEAATFAAMQSDVIWATGSALDALLPIRRNEGEEDEDYRLRGLGLRDVVTPAAICAAVNVLIAPYTCGYLEPELDQFFVNGDANTSTWGAFVDVAPQYPDRLYPDDAASNAGVVKPNVNPGAAGFYNLDGDGRVFVIEIPDLSNLNQTIRLIFDGTTFAPGPLAPEQGGAIGVETGAGQSLGGTGLFLMDNTPGTITNNRCFLYDNSTSEDARYAQIVDVVERLRGGGFQWMLSVAT